MTSTGPTSTEVTLLNSVLEAAHAVVYGYGVLGARLNDTDRRAALLAFDGHRARRDQVAAQLRDRGSVPAVALPAYDVAVSGVPDALALAVRLEEGIAVRWRALVGGTDEVSLRGLAIAGLQECAVRAAQWRRLAGSSPVTVALPGSA